MVESSRLGKGLESLLGISPQQEEKQMQEKLGVEFIALDKIEPNPFQPRKNFNIASLQELANSLKNHGLIQPITVSKLKNGLYQLIAGERRLRAAHLAKLDKIPSFVIEIEQNDLIEMSIVENLQREDLNNIEIAIHFQRMIDQLHITHQELSKKVGKDRSTVSNFLRLLKLPPDIQIALRDNKISMGHARALINVDTPDLQLHLLDVIVKNELSVRQIEDLVKNHLANIVAGEQAVPVKPTTNIYIANIQNTLEKKFNLKINIKEKNNKGKIEFYFKSLSEFNRIVDELEK